VITERKAGDILPDGEPRPIFFRQKTCPQVTGGVKSLMGVVSRVRLIKGIEQRTLLGISLTPRLWPP